MLAERFADYAQSLPGTNWMKTLGPLAAVSLSVEQVLPLATRLPCIIAISGALAHEDTLARSQTH